jgi:hypothetical protein
MIARVLSSAMVLFVLGGAPDRRVEHRAAQEPTPATLAAARPQAPGPLATAGQGEAPLTPPRTRSAASSSR